MKSENHIKLFFNKFSRKYDGYAFNYSLGLKFLDLLEKGFIVENLEKNEMKNKKVLDVGIGTGRVSSIFAKNGCRIYGLDISEDMSRKAERKLRKSLVSITIKDAQSGLPFSSNFFDLCVSFRVLKYMKNWKFVISEMRRVLKPNGLIFIEFSNKKSLSIFGTRNANYSLLDKNSVINFLKNSDFNILKIQGGSKLTFNLYRRIKTKKMLKFIKILENYLKKIFGNNYSRNIMIMASVKK